VKYITLLRPAILPGTLLVSRNSLNRRGEFNSAHPLCPRIVQRLLHRHAALPDGSGMRHPAAHSGAAWKPV